MSDVYIVAWYTAHNVTHGICGVYTSEDVAAEQARKLYDEPYYTGRGVLVERVPLDTPVTGGRRVLHFHIDRDVDE